MGIKLIASDLDGTLMAADHMTVTKRTYNALKNAHDKGIKIAVATGRPLALIGDVIKQIPFVDYVIYSNGACVYDRNKKADVYKKIIPDKAAREIVGRFLDMPAFFEVYINGRSCYQKGTEQRFSSNDLPQEFIDAVAKTMDGYDSLLDFMEQDGGGIEKITFYSLDDTEYPEYKKTLQGFGLNAVTSLPGTIEATEPGADKGNALRGISEILKISPGEVMSFGDAGNDCPMLRFADFSFAMENGMDECKAAAKFITKSNADDGVAIMIEKYCLSD